MKVNELRIGNRLRPDERHEASYGDNPAWVTSITEHGFVVCNHYPGKWFEPIPLTEEWLIKFGFDKFPNGNAPHYTYKINKFNIIDFEYSGTGDYFREFLLPLSNFNFFMEGDFVKVKYVHQLQNLYFDLEAKELEIKS